MDLLNEIKGPPRRFVFSFQYMQDSRTKPQFAPCIFTGQEAGTADALAAQNKVTPMELDVKLLPDTLNKQRARVSLKYVANAVG